MIIIIIIDFTRIDVGLIQPRMSPTSSPCTSAEPVPVTVAAGDGIGPEILEATLVVLAAAGARLAPERVLLGEAMYRAGHSSGVPPEAWDSLRRTRLLLKGPISTPQGGGFKSVNVTLRKTLGLYANVRPCVAYAPFIRSRHPRLDLVIVRENEEDLYAGIEHRQTDEVYQCLKLITRPGCERIVRYAFAHARAHGRHSVTCMTKDNIMKLTDGLFHRVFDEVAAEYPEIRAEHMIVDIGAARLADTPERFDVIVTPNLYGDILSDVAAQLAGSVGLAGSSNIGDGVAMFEAIHGSAPDIAGKGLANPSGLLHAAISLLTHVGQREVATRIHNAWLTAIEHGVVTADVASGGEAHVGTAEFTAAVIERLGERPTRLKAVEDHGEVSLALPRYRRAPPASRTLVGVDIFVHSRDQTPTELAAQLQRHGLPDFTLQMITNRGVKVWPEGFPETFCTDHWRCRFMAPAPIAPARIVALLGALVEGEVDVIKTEHLCNFDGVPGYALGQGQ